jgi:hypothetical protein
MVLPRAFIILTAIAGKGYKIVMEKFPNHLKQGFNDYE